RPQHPRRAAPPSQTGRGGPSCPTLRARGSGHRAAKIGEGEMNRDDRSAVKWNTVPIWSPVVDRTGGGCPRAGTRGVAGQQREPLRRGVIQYKTFALWSRV